MLVTGVEPVSLCYKGGVKSTATYRYTSLCGFPFILPEKGNHLILNSLNHQEAS